MKYVAKHLEDIQEIAQNVLTEISRQASEKDTERKSAFVVCLSGELGAGKTTFTQAVAHILGIEEKVTSPTFVIEKIYKIKHTYFTHLIHIDAYRLESGKELLTLGWKEIVENPKNLILLEWPEKVADIMDNIHDKLKINFKHIDEKTRSIEMV